MTAEPQFLRRLVIQLPTVIITDRLIQLNAMDLVRPRTISLARKLLFCHK